MSQCFSFHPGREEGAFLGASISPLVQAWWWLQQPAQEYRKMKQCILAPAREKKEGIFFLGPLFLSSSRDLSLIRPGGKGGEEAEEVEEEEEEEVVVGPAKRRRRHFHFPSRPGGGGEGEKSFPTLALFFWHLEWLVCLLSCSPLRRPRILAPGDARQRRKLCQKCSSRKSWGEE